ncbi:MAG: hypothetical protein II863_03565 [Kiritimatiellae bacterium]|nr:hypothetical protein [Kiritimatiellia bacterium]
MKRFAYAIALLAFAGCSSYSEIARWDGVSRTNDGEVPLASFVTQNFSYQLLGCIPICTGLPWTEGNADVCDDYNVSLFSDQATIDNNMVSLRHALNRVGSKRIAQLRTTEKDDSDWSLYLINRHEVRTYCIILPK